MSHGVMPCGLKLDKELARQREQPSVEALLAELPQIEWP
jgi:hypothetical protein